MENKIFEELFLGKTLTQPEQPVGGDTEVLRATHPTVRIVSTIPPI